MMCISLCYYCFFFKNDQVSKSNDAFSNKHKIKLHETLENLIWMEVFEVQWNSDRTIYSNIKIDKIWKISSTKT